MCPVAEMSMACASQAEDKYFPVECHAVVGGPLSAQPAPPISPGKVDVDSLALFFVVLLFCCIVGVLMAFTQAGAATDYGGEGGCM